MTAQQVEEIIKFFGVIAGSVVAIWRFFDYMTVRVKEKSVGATAIAKLFEADIKIKEDLEKLRDLTEEQKEALEKVARDYREIMQEILELYKMKK